MLKHEPHMHLELYYVKKEAGQSLRKARPTYITQLLCMKKL